VFSGFSGTDGREREVQGHYEYDALEEYLQFESIRFEKAGTNILKFKDPLTEVYIHNPEAGIPYIVEMIAEDEYHNPKDQLSMMWDEVYDATYKAFDHIYSTALECVKKDFSRKTNVFVHNPQPATESTLPLSGGLSAEKLMLIGPPKVTIIDNNKKLVI
jgi:methionine salvage enolase-phosphatase E1